MLARFSVDHLLICTMVDDDVASIAVQPSLCPLQLPVYGFTIHVVGQ